MKKIKQLSIGKQVLLMFGLTCAVLIAIGAFPLLSLRSIQHTSHRQLSYVVNKADLIGAAAQNVGLMQAVIFRHVLATDPIEIELVIAPQCTPPR